MKKSPKNSSSGLPRVVRQINLQAVTRRMRHLEHFSKVDLARDLGISTTTMTKLFAQLEAEQIIEKSTVLDTTFGRPKILYQLSPALQVAAIVIDVDFTSVSLSNLQGNVLPANTISFPTGTEPKALFSLIKQEFSKLQKTLDAPCRLIGICIPGLIESDKGRSMLNPNLHWMEGICPADTLSKMLGISAFVIHEEMALNRAQLRTMDDTADYITMDFSAGVGMSVVSNGQLLSGTSGFAGEIGHIIMQPGGKKCGCGNRGCLETLASDRVYEKLVKTKGKDAAAKETMRWQTIGLAAAINIFNPEKIFVYSRLAEIHSNYIEKLRKETGKYAIGLAYDQCTIQATRAGKLEGALLRTIDTRIEHLITPEVNE